MLKAKGRGLCVIGWRSTVVFILVGEYVRQQVGQATLLRPSLRLLRFLPTQFVLQQWKHVQLQEVNDVWTKQEEEVSSLGGGDGAWC